MRIECPWCGPRQLKEFSYGGAADCARPKNPEDADLRDWMDHVYLRANPAGRHREYWQHVAGCRCWLIVTRDTTNHEIEHVALAHPQLQDLVT